jgi:hypothetical protein
MMEVRFFQELNGSLEAIEDNNSSAAYYALGSFENHQ